MVAAQLAVAPVGDESCALKLSSRLERADGVSDSLPLEKHALSVNQSLSDVAPGNVSALFCLSQRASKRVNKGAYNVRICQQHQKSFNQTGPINQLQRVY